MLIKKIKDNLINKINELSKMDKIKEDLNIAFTELEKTRKQLQEALEIKERKENESKEIEFQIVKLVKYCNNQRQETADIEKVRDQDIKKLESDLKGKEEENNQLRSVNEDLREQIERFRKYATEVSKNKTALSMYIIDKYRTLMKESAPPAVKASMFNREYNWLLDKINEI
jgi:hypothetical protein